MQNLDLDWLLIPLGQEEIFLNIVYFQGRTIYPRTAAEYGPSGKVILATGSSGQKYVQASSKLCGFFIPSVGRILDTWSVYLDQSSLKAGDSGSWAISESGEVYGSLVGTSEGGNMGYITLMARTIASIRAQNPGLEVTFPADTVPGGVSVLGTEITAMRAHP